ncbi:MAG TPA: hypothetical protein VGJ15_05270 [Pirellulales bacterium]
MACSGWLSAAEQGVAQSVPAPPADAATAPKMPLPEGKMPDAAGAKSTSDSTGGCCNSCAPYKMVERTVYCATPVHEMRKVQCVEYTTEQQQKNVTIMKLVPQKETVTQQYCVMVPEKRTRTEDYTVCKPVPSKDGCGPCETVQEKRQRVVAYTVCVPQTRQRQVEICTTKYVPDQRSVTVNVCVPHTVEKEVEVCAYHLTPKKIMVAVPTCPPCLNLGPCCGPCRG